MDVVITVEPTYPYGVPTFRKSTAEQIARILGFEINFVQIKMPIEPDPYNFVHQFATFVSVAHLWVVKDKSISEIWAGRNQAEVPVIKDPNNFKTQQILAWQTMHPNIPFVHPLEHLTKQQHWEMIPNDIKPLISSCIFHNSCGKCEKCVEFARLVQT